MQDVNVLKGQASGYQFSSETKEASSLMLKNPSWLEAHRRPGGPHLIIHRTHPNRALRQAPQVTMETTETGPHNTLLIFQSSKMPV